MSAHEGWIPARLPGIVRRMLIPSESPRANLRLLWWLRCLAITGQALAVAVTQVWLGIDLPVVPLACVIGFSAIVNLLTFIRLKQGGRIGEAEFFAQLLLDMAALALLLYWTGGAANPFTSLFLLQVAIAAVTLRRLYAWLAACAGIGCYTLLMFFNVPVSYFSHHMDGFFTLHVQGMWINFILLTGLITWFLSRMSDVIRHQDRKLAEADRAASLGLLAANAAHELGTPLATLLVLAQELEAQANPEIRRAAGLMSGQIGRCKSILSRIASLAGAPRAESGDALPLDVVLRETLERWRHKRPEASLVAQTSGHNPAPGVSAESGLEQAIVNLLDNAADSSAAPIRFHAAWTEDRVQISVTDGGTGFPPALLRDPGGRPQTTKPAGMGIGLALTRTSVMRRGGMLHVRNSPSGGVAIIDWPLGVP